MIMSVDAEKASHILRIKTFGKLIIQENSCDLIKVPYEKLYC